VLLLQDASGAQVDFHTAALSYLNHYGVCIALLIEQGIMPRPIIRIYIIFVIVGYQARRLFA
jgi:hypothetical protein